MPLLKCEDCSNSNGTIEKDGKLYECMCFALRRLSSQMPPYIRKAEVQGHHLSLPIVRKPQKHYYILSSWSDMKAIIKLVMILNSNRHIRITSDREIRDVYVGSKSKKSLGENSESEILNSLEDLVLFPHIVIIRTNELRYKNRAASGALEEAMSIRLDRDKPLWIINSREERFGKGSISWSESVDELLDTGFEYIEIPMINHHAEMSRESPTPLKVQGAPKFLSGSSIPEEKSSPKKEKKRKKKDSPLDLVSIDEEEDDLDEPVVRNRLTIDSSSLDLRDGEDGNPLDEYGSGVKSSKKWGRRG